MIQPHDSARINPHTQLHDMDHKSLNQNTHVNPNGIPVCGRRASELPAQNKTLRGHNSAPNTIQTLIVGLKGPHQSKRIQFFKNACMSRPVLYLKSKCRLMNHFRVGAGCPSMRLAGADARFGRDSEVNSSAVLWLYLTTQRSLFCVSVDEDTHAHA